QPVRMMLLDQCAITFASHLEGNAPLQPQNGVRIVCPTLDVPDRNTIESDLVITENIGYACKKGHFLVVYIAIGSGDMKKAVEDVFQQMTIGLSFAAQSGKLARI